MATDKPNIREGMRRLARDRRPREHPSPEKLAEYHAGDLPAQEVAPLQDHLAECPDCAQMLLHLELFEDLDSPPGHSPATEEQMDQEWHRLRKRLRTDPESKAKGPTPGGPQEVVPGHGSDGGETDSDGKVGDVAPLRRGSLSPRRDPWPWLTAVAATAAVALGGWSVSQHLRLRDLSAPQLNAPVIQLSPEGATRSPGGEAPVLSLLETGGYLVLGGAPQATPDGSEEYEISIVEATEGGERFRRRGLQPQPGPGGPFFSVWVPPGFLLPGTYRVVVRSQEPPPQFSVRYRLEVTR